MKVSIGVCILLALLCIGSMSFQSHAQRRRKSVRARKPTITETQPSPTATPVPEPPTRKVTVKLKNGNSVDAYLVRASADKLELMFAGNQVTIGMDEVAAIILSPELFGSKRPLTQEEMVQSALKNLGKLEAAVDVGVNFSRYGSLLIDVKSEVDESLAAMKDSDLKSELTGALEAYVDAGQAWNRMTQSGSEKMFPDVDPLATLLWVKYSIPIEVTDPGKNVPSSIRKAAPPGSINPFRSMEKNVILNTIWAAGKSHLEKTALLISQKDQVTKP